MSKPNLAIQRDVNLLMMRGLAAAGWSLTRDNEAGGALVLEKDGVYIVGGFHAYELPASAESHAEVAVEDAFSKVLVPALAAGNGKVPLGWVAERYEDGSVEWWTDDSWVDSLSDAAVFTNEERTDDIPDANWVEVYGHEVDGCLTTEACPGVDTCPDCLDVRKSAGENIADDPMPGHNDSSEEDV